MENSRLEQRVTQAADATLAERGYVSAVDVLLRPGWLAPSQLDRWRVHTRRTDHSDPHALGIALPCRLSDKPTTTRSRCRAVIVAVSWVTGA